MASTRDARVGMLVAAILLAAWARTEAAEDAAEPWEREIALGLNRTQGNSDTEQVRAKIGAKKKGTVSRWDLGAQGTYGESDGERTTDNAKAFAEGERLFSKRVFGLLRAAVEYDSIAEVNYRLVAGPGVGCYLVKKETVELRAEVGPSYITEDVAGKRQNYPVLRAAERFERRWTKKSKLYQYLEYLPDLRSSDNYFVNSEIGIEAAANDTLSLRISVEHKHTAEPAEGKEKTDTTIASALVFKL